MPLFAVALLLLTSAHASELWIRARVHGEREVRMDLPANWVAELPAPLEITVGEGEEKVDVREVARAFRERGPLARHAVRTQWEGAEVKLVIHNRRTPWVEKNRSQALRMSAEGPKGRSLDVEIPLVLGSFALNLGSQALGAQVTVPGLAVPWTDASFLGQVTRSRPRVLLDIEGQEGGHFRVESR